MWFSGRWLKLAVLVVSLTYIRSSAAAFISPCTLDTAYERAIEESCDAAGKVSIETSRRPINLAVAAAASASAVAVSKSSHTWTSCEILDFHCVFSLVGHAW